MNKKFLGLGAAFNGDVNFSLRTFSFSLGDDDDDDVDGDDVGIASSSRKARLKAEAVKATQKPCTDF